MFYAIGSFLFAFAFLAALAVIAGNMIVYWDKMLAALRTLSLDRVGATAAPSPSLRTRRPALPGPVLPGRPATAQ